MVPTILIQLVATHARWEHESTGSLPEKNFSLSSLFSPPTPLDSPMAIYFIETWSKETFFPKAKERKGSERCEANWKLQNILRRELLVATKNLGRDRINLILRLSVVTGSREFIDYALADRSCNIRYDASFKVVLSK